MNKLPMGMKLGESVDLIEIYRLCYGSNPIHLSVQVGPEARGVVSQKAQNPKSGTFGTVSRDEFGSDQDDLWQDGRSGRDRRFPNHPIGIGPDAEDRP
jgi:hypothetical protein